MPHDCADHGRREARVSIRGYCFARSGAGVLAAGFLSFCLAAIFFGFDAGFTNRLKQLRR